MKNLKLLALIILVSISVSRAQYNGKYVGWSMGYIFTGSLNSIVWKAYTHVVNFQVTVSSDGSIKTGSLNSDHAAFIAACHQHGVKALVCIGGAGQSKNFTAACSNPATQTKLVNNIVNLVKTAGYDGVDMDWEAGEENDNAAMVVKFKSLHKELRDSINKMSPRPMMTAAVATDWYPNSTAAIAEYVDQLNNMSYYNYVTDMDKLFKPVLDKGVPKKLQGVGFGFDTDNEITDIKDIAAKCRYSIDNGYGGIMVWDITHAPAVTSDTIATYVTHNISTGVSPSRNASRSRGHLSALNNGMAGLKGLSYSVPWAKQGAFVDLGIYDLHGRLVKTLVHGYGQPGTHRISLEESREAGALKPGAYFVRLSVDSEIETAKAFIAD